MQGRPKLFGKKRVNTPPRRGFQASRERSVEDNVGKVHVAAGSGKRSAKNMNKNVFLIKKIINKELLQCLFYLHC